MEYIEINGDKIPKIGLGTWSWGNGFNGGNSVFGNNLQLKDLRSVFEEAMQLGFTFWDTAPVYGMGASESILGSLCSGEEILSTKFAPIRWQGRNAMRKSLMKSMSRLHREVIDFYWIHTDINVGKWTREIAILAKEGLIKHIGVSNHTLPELIEVSDILNEYGLKLSAVQNHYSLLYRDSEEKGILDWCHRSEVAFFAYMVLEQGALSGKYNSDHPFSKKSRRGKIYDVCKLERMEPLVMCMRQIGEKYSINPSQIAVAWAIAKETIPIIGATKSQHIVEAEQSLSVKLKESEIRKLEQIAEQLQIDVKAKWEPAQV